MTIRVVSACIGAMLGLVNAVDVNAEEGIGEVAVAETGGVGEEEVDEQATEGEQHTEAEVAKAGVDVEGGDDAIVVAVPEGDVLLQSCEVGHGRALLTDFVPYVMLVVDVACQSEQTGESTSTWAREQEVDGIREKRCEENACES